MFYRLGLTFRFWIYYFQLTFRWYLFICKNLIFPYYRHSFFLYAELSTTDTDIFELIESSTYSNVVINNDNWKIRFLF